MRDLSNLTPSESFQYLLQVDSGNNVQTGLGAPYLPASSSYALTSSISQQALTASYISPSGVNQLTSSFISNVSFNNFTASYKQDSASFSASIADLYTGSGGGGGGSQNLQDVTTLGNETSQSIFITGSLVNGDGSAVASGQYSHAEGTATTAIGVASHAEGNSTRAIEIGAHSEGTGTTAAGNGSHSEGSNATAVGANSHAEGNYTIAIGSNSHAEGRQTTAIGQMSHAEGYGTIASVNYQHAEGQWNLEDSDAIWIVGNGFDEFARTNIIAAYFDKIAISGNLDITGDYLKNGNPIGGGSTDVSTYLSSSWTGSTTSQFSGTSSFATTASYAINISPTFTASFALTSSFSETSLLSQNSQTASYVSGAVLNIPDPFTSTPPATTIVTLTSAEYTALGTKNPNTLYIVI